MGIFFSRWFRVGGTQQQKQRRNRRQKPARRLLSAEMLENRSLNAAMVDAFAMTGAFIEPHLASQASPAAEVFASPLKTSPDLCSTGEHFSPAHGGTAVAEPIGFHAVASFDATGHGVSRHHPLPTNGGLPDHHTADASSRLDEHSSSQARATLAVTQQGGPIYIHQGRIITASNPKIAGVGYSVTIHPATEREAQKWLAILNREYYVVKYNPQGRW